MLTALKRWRAGRQARRIADQAAEIARAWGEDWHEDWKYAKPGDLLPIAAPQWGDRYEDDLLCITRTEWLVRIAFEGKPVLVVDRHGLREVRRFNYGAEWVEHVHSLYADLRSKQARAERARFEALDKSVRSTPL